jgi:CRISPR type III-B/RAMP module RAMP protein Cmr6
MPETRAVGPLAATLRAGQLRGREPDDPRYATANALLLLHRSAVLSVADDGTIELDDSWIRSWSLTTRLGQGPAVTARDGLPGKVAARRRAALRALCADGHTTAVTVTAAPEAAMVTGTGAGGIRDVGIELHGTYGWPVLPGSALKGLAHAYARDEAQTAREELDRLFGRPPRADALAWTGTVTFLDALPGPEGIAVAEHVRTPHTRGYRQDPDDKHAEPSPPAEYLNPVPIPFLVLSGGTFTIHLIGPESEVTEAAMFLVEAFSETGLGAKTTSGYGYLQAESVPGIAEPPDPRASAQTKSAQTKKGSRR